MARGAAGRRSGAAGRDRFSVLALGVCLLLAVLVMPRVANATDFYEIQIYSIDTVPEGQFMAELHSNYISTAVGEASKSNLPLYQTHATYELTYGLLPYLEVGQYLCTAMFEPGKWEYAGARSKVHFGIPQTEDWPVQFGANIELQYMRRAAVPDPFNIEFMPIVETHWRRLTAIANFSFEKQFSGPGTRAGISLEPMGQISYLLTKWFEPSLEYFGDIGAVKEPYIWPEQQQFIVPAVNLYLMPQLEFNFGVGFGITTNQHGTFEKGTIGWLF